MEDRKEEVRKTAKWHHRAHDGEDVGVGYYMKYHMFGRDYLYANHSKEHTMKVDMHFKLVNCSIKGTNEDHIHLKLEPGESELVEIRQDAGARSHQCTLESEDFSCSCDHANDLDLSHHK